MRTKHALTVALIGILLLAGTLATMRVTKVAREEREWNQRLEKMREDYLNMQPSLAGEWTLIARPDHVNTRIWRMTETNGGIAFLSNNGKDVYWWDENTDRIELLDIHTEGGIVGIGGVGNEIVIFSRVVEYLYHGDLLIRRYNIRTHELTVDPQVPTDDRHRYYVSNSATSVVVDGKIYLFGGCCSPATAAIWVYDPRTYELRHVTEIPPADDPNRIFQVGIGATWDGESFIVAAGGTSGGRESAEREHLQAYNLREDRWTTVASTRGEHVNGPIVIHDDTIWLFNGCVLYATRDDPYLRGDASAPYPGGPTLTRGGKHYVYTIDFDSPAPYLEGLFEWTPPDLKDWPNKPARREYAKHECGSW